MKATFAFSMLVSAASIHAVTAVGAAENIALGKPYTFSNPPNYKLCTDAGDKTVNRCDCFAVIVQLHIESLDLFGIVCDKDRAAVDFFCEIPLVLRLQIAPPLDFVLELVIVL